MASINSRALFEMPGRISGSCRVMILSSWSVGARPPNSSPNSPQTGRAAPLLTYNGAGSFATAAWCPDQQRCRAQCAVRTALSFDIAQVRFGEPVPGPRHAAAANALTLNELTDRSGEFLRLLHVRDVPGAFDID